MHILKECFQYRTQCYKPPKEMDIDMCCDAPADDTETLRQLVDMVT